MFSTSILPRFSADGWRRAADWLLAILFLAGVPLLAHSLYSWMGFNPTDDGFTLAYGRRILDGQIPHRDFIIIRPFLSPVLHLAEAAWAGDNMLMVSRLVVWVQFACMAWLWTRMTNRMLGRPMGGLACFAAALISFVFSVNIWPIMAWHTVDGLFLATLGLVLCTGENARMKAPGYMLIAGAYLCKQSFLFAAPLALIIMGDWRHPRYWLAVIAPGAVYLLYLKITGALDEAMIQFIAHTAMQPILDRYWWDLTFWFFFGYLMMRWLYRQPPICLWQNRPALQSWIGFGLILAFPIYENLKVLYQSNPHALSHANFWVVAGTALYFIFDGGSAGRLPRHITLLSLLLAFCVSVSIGASTPAMMAGPLLVILLAHALKIIRRPDVRTLLMLVLAGAVLLGFDRSRHDFVYMEQPAPRLNCPLDGVFYGARGVKTNPNTYAFLKDLQKAVTLARKKGDPYAILPDIPGYWATSVQQNPLPIDWAKNTELHTDILINRVQAALDARHSHLTVIVQKVEAFPLRFGFRPLRDREKFVMAHYVRTHFKKCGETKYFELYR